jgi:hypothetical protein
MPRAKFMEGRDGVSDSLHGDMVKEHMKQNWAINPQNQGGPFNRLAGEGGDNQGYRLMPGRKNGIFSGKGDGS